MDKFVFLAEVGLFTIPFFVSRVRGFSRHPCGWLPFQPEGRLSHGLGRSRIFSGLPLPLLHGRDFSSLRISLSRRLILSSGSTGWRSVFARLIYFRSSASTQVLAYLSMKPPLGAVVSRSHLADWLFRVWRYHHIFGACLQLFLKLFASPLLLLVYQARQVSSWVLPIAVLLLHCRSFYRHPIFFSFTRQRGDCCAGKK